MYLSKDTLSSDNWLNSSTENFIKTAVHEGTHASFGTVSNAMLFNFLSHDADLVSKVKQQAQAKGYNFDAQTLEQINTKLQQGQKLTQQETDLFNEYQDEISAQMAAEVLGNKKFMQRFTLSQRSAAAKVLNRIMAVADALSALKSTKARAEYLRYKTAAKLWTSALAELGAHYSNGNIIFNDKDEENSTQDSANGTQFSLKGTDSNGIEIYETSEDIRSLSNAEKRKLFVQQMRNEFRGRTAKFTVDGETYYARFAHADVNKLAYGDKRSDIQGRSAKLNIEADGDIFDLTENARYYASTDEREGKNSIAHNGVTSWDYFVKTVNVDNAVYDVVINVRESNGNKFVYDIAMRINKKITPSLSMSSTESALVSNEEVTSTDSIRKNSENVNTSDKKSPKFSLKDSVNKVYYRKKDIRRILDDVVSDLYSDSLVVDMTNKTRDNIIDEYQSKFNSTPQSRHLAIALDMAQFILDNVTATSIFESEYNSERIDNATNKLAVLRRYLRRLNLSQADMRSEIKYKHDNNTLKVYARWSHRGGNATTKTAAIRLWK